MSSVLQGAGDGLGDRIVVRDLRLWAHVGVLESERQLGQWFELDLELGVDLSAAAAGFVREKLEGADQGAQRQGLHRLLVGCRGRFVGVTVAVNLVMSHW